MFKQVVQGGLVAAVLATGLGAAHAEGLYVGGAIGTPEYHGNVNGIGGSGSGAGGKIYGGYELTPNFSIEAGFTDPGHVDGGNGKVDLRGVYLDGVGHYPLVSRLSAYGSIGVAEGRFKTSAGSDSSPALKVGAGLEYDVSKTVELRAGYDQYNFTNAFDGKPRVGEFALGIKIGF